MAASIFDKNKKILGSMPKSKMPKHVEKEKGEPKDSEKAEKLKALRGM